MAKRLTIAAMLVLLMGATTMVAQQPSSNLNTHPVWEAVSPGGLAARNPGNLVNAGISRFNSFQGSAFSPPEITEPARPRKLITELKIQALQAVFQNLNAVLLAFDNVIRAQAGFAPYVPSPIRPGSSSTNVDSLTSLFSRQQ